MNKENRSTAKATVIVLDPGVIKPSTDRHAELLKEFFSKLVNFHRMDYFLQPSIERGEIAVGITPDMIVELDPALIISELSMFVIGDLHWHWGVKMIKNMKKNQRSANIPIVVISEHVSNEKVKRELERLGVKFVFTWSELGEDREKREELVRTVEALVETHSILSERRD